MSKPNKQIFVRAARRRRLEAALLAPLAPQVKNPTHYTQHPSGVECITIAQEFPFSLGCAIKYIWRAGLKSPDAITDLRKAREYLKFEIERLGGEC